MSSLPITLTDEEIKNITGYSRPKFQILVLEKLGIKALKRPDNSVLVLRRDCLYPTNQIVSSDPPKLKLSKK